MDDSPQFYYRRLLRLAIAQLLKASRQLLIATTPELAASAEGEPALVTESALDLFCDLFEQCTATAISA